VRLIAIAALSAIACTAPPAPADAGPDAGPRDAALGCETPRFAASERVEIRGWDGDAMEPFLSRDGRWLFFNTRDQPAPDDMDLHYAERADDLLFEYRGEIAGANSDALDGVPSLDDEGNLYFVSLRSYDTTFSTIHRGTFDAGLLLNAALVSGVSREMPGWVNFDAEISADAERLWAVDGLFDSATNFWSRADLFTARRDGDSFAREDASALAAINTELLEYAPAVSRDGLLLLFTRMDHRGGGVPRLHAAVRTRVDGAFCASVEVPAPPGFVEAPTFAPDEGAIYFHHLDGVRFVLRRAERF